MRIKRHVRDQEDLSRQNASLREKLVQAEQLLRAAQEGAVGGLGLLDRLEEAEETLNAIRNGKIDALVVKGKSGQEVLTLQGADQTYRTIFETMNEGVALVDRDGIILRCNPRMGCLLKQPVEDLVGSRFHQFLPPEALLLLEGILNSELSPEMSGKEMSFVCADGSTTPVQVTTNPLELSGSQALCVVASEITQLKRSEESLQKSEDRFRSLIEDVRDYAIIALNENGEVESWNKGAERVTGFRAEEILGRNFSCFYQPEQVAAGQPQRVLEVAREHGRFEEEGWRLRKDGSLFWAHVAITALRDREGRLIGFSKVTHDLTRSREAEESLRQSERLFHSAANHFPGGFVIYDSRQRVQFVNRHALEILGKEEGECIGKTCAELIPAEITEAVCPTLDRCFAERTPQTIEYQLHLPEGDFSRVVTFVPIEDEKGELRQVLGIGYDVTDRRRAEEQIREALRKEVVLRREIQHRVKNSIQIISSLLFLQACELTDPKMIEVLRECQARARSIALVYGMLSQRVELGKVDFVAYAQQLIGGLSSAYEIQRQTVSFDIRAENVFLDLDTAVPCGLILTELISNALKYAFPEHKSGHVNVDLERLSEHELMLTVRDDGVGLPLGFGTEEENSSLGLRLVRDLTQQIGGQIEFFTERGTTVKIRFPLQAR
jgi:PAS domain S-box-containing protein